MLCLHGDWRLTAVFFFCVSLQSQQARLVTLYLPLFGLLQENVHRLDIKEAAAISSHSVSLVVK